MTNESPKDKVFDWLDAHRGEWPTVSKEAGVGYWWILKFMGRKIGDPGFDKIDRLSRYIRDRDRQTADAQESVDAGNPTTQDDADQTHKERAA